MSLGSNPLALFILDQFFLYFHLCFSIFNLTGWAWRKTRRWHFICVSLTGFSWFGLGLFYGMGYCPLTDWHWMVREKLGHAEMPDSYVKFVIDHFTGLDLNATVVEWITGISFTMAFCLSIHFNFMRNHRREARTKVNSA